MSARADKRDRQHARLRVGADRLSAAGGYSEAEAAYRGVIRVRPTDWQAHYNLGNALYRQGRDREAVQAFDDCLIFNRRCADATYFKAMALLRLGQYRPGWRLHEARWDSIGWERYKALQQTGHPTWLGKESLAGKTIMLYGEQGFGDAIQFARYAPLVAAMAERTLLAIDPALNELFACVPGLESILSPGHALPPIDYRVPLMSLPLAFGTTLETIPAADGYLTAPARAVRDWEQRLGYPRRARIGLCWSGRPQHVDDANRSLAFAELLPLISAVSADWISLQQDSCTADGSTAPLRRFDDDLTTFAETAGLIANLDLVITVDTAVAHLAGALGKPVWILLPFSPDWRWLHDRTDSPWYRSARLYRQPKPGDWASVLARVGDELYREEAAA